MRLALFIILVSVNSLPAIAQKVPVQVTKAKNISVSDWQILNEQYIPVFSSAGYFREDSVNFTLEENRRYFMEVSLSDVTSSDSTLYCLIINNEVILRIGSDIAPGDHFFPFFTGVRQGQTKITGGTSAAIADYPWQVFFESGGFTCGGSIISGNWIITAAHCTEDESGNLIPASEMDVIVGANNPRSGTEGKKYNVSQVVRHEKYNRSTLNNDIALLKLDATISYPNATPIRLVSKIDSASGATDPGVMSWVTGYGLIRVSPQTDPTTLQKVQLPIVSNTQASSVWDNIAPTDMMAGFLNGNKDACNGDSGGPLVVPVDNEYKVAGLVSWGSTSCDTYGAYTRVSEFESWITGKTGIEISYMPPVPAGDSIVCQGVVSSQYHVGPINSVTSYEWQLLPAEAGTVQVNSETSVVTWKQGYVGKATLRLRVTKFNIVSYWSALTIHIAKYNSLLSQSNDTIICAGEPLKLKVASEGYNLHYSWFKDNSLIKSGSSPELTFNNATKDSTGIYRCDITGSCGGMISPEISLIVLPVTVIKNITQDTVALSGGNLTIKVFADGHNLLYQWQKDGNQIPDGTNPELYLQNVNASFTGLYNVIVSGSCGEEPSKNVYVYITKTPDHSDPKILVWPTLVSSEFSVALSDDRNYNLQLFSSTGKLLVEKSNCRYKTVLDISNFSRGVYIITVYGSNFRKSVKLIRN